MHPMVHWEATSTPGQRLVLALDSQLALGTQLDGKSDGRGESMGMAAMAVLPPVLQDQIQDVWEKWGFLKQFIIDGPGAKTFKTSKIWDRFVFFFFVTTSPHMKKVPGNSINSNWINHDDINRGFDHIP